MGLSEEYGERLSRLHEDLEQEIPDGELARLKESLDDVLPVVLILLFFVVVFSFIGPVSDRMAAWITYANYVVILYFASRLLVEYRLSDPEGSFFRNHILDFAMLIPAFSILEEVKLAAALEDSELAAGSAAQAGVVARLTKISRIIRRSI
ncbi:MAG: hypothetical protein ABEJ03_01210 [Candidatus Nanohaloarchaea archaeon]